MEMPEEALVPTATRPDSRLALLIIVLTFSGFFLWASLSEVDSGALAYGEVVPDGRVRTIQHLEGGIIKAIRVRDGDRVSEGEELLVLDDREIRSVIEIAEHDIQGYRTRLADVNREIESWSSRRKSLATLSANAEEEARINQELYEKKFISRPRLLQLESQKAQADVTIGENSAELARAHQKKSEIEAAQSATRERKAMAQQRLERVRIVAPQDGIVSNLKYTTLGGVIPPGGIVLDLVPNSEELVVEAKISPDDIDVVYPGLVTRVKLTAYKARSHISLKGKVIGVSATTLRDDSTQGRPYYRARIEIGAEELKKVDRGMLTPGMLVEVSVIAGRRTVLRYLFDPVIESFGRAFRES